MQGDHTARSGGQHRGLGVLGQRKYIVGGPYTERRTGWKAVLRVHCTGLEDLQQALCALALGIL